MTFTETQIAETPTNRGFFNAMLREHDGRVRNRSASEVLGILAPAADEPQAVMTMAFWKTGGFPPPDGRVQ